MNVLVVVVLLIVVVVVGVVFEVVLVVLAVVVVAVVLFLLVVVVDILLLVIVVVIFLLLAFATCTCPTLRANCFYVSICNVCVFFITSLHGFRSLWAPLHNACIRKNSLSAWLHFLQ